MILKILKQLVRAMAPYSWLPLAEVLMYLCEVVETCGGTLIAVGIAAHVVLACVLATVVALGGPIPLTPGVLAGMGAWLALDFGVLVSAPIELLVRFLPFKVLRSNPL